MKMYVLMISDGKSNSSAILFETEREAFDYTVELEEGQKFIEGSSYKCIRKYRHKDLVVPPFFNSGKFLYCSVVTTLFRGEESYTWRAIYEQEVEHKQ